MDNNPLSKIRHLAHDIEAYTVGATGILVLTGETTREEGEAARPPPDLMLLSIQELTELLATVRL
jgi:ribonucleotide monophosphatase NagD (HAD superfamily)